MMTAQLQMKRMLDALMGTGRDGEDTTEKLSFTSSRVCKCFLLKCCPHDVLSATRCDLGQCPRVHNVALRADYENASKKKDYNFEIEVLETLRKFLSESERRSKVAKKRLKLTQDVLNTEETIRLDKIKLVEEKIKQALAKAEELGATGEVEEAKKITESIEELKKEKETAEEEYTNALPSSVGQQQKLRVCEVCSSYLGLEDNDKRLADHFNGRMHLGFLFIRGKVEELENLIQDKYIKKFLDNEFGTSDSKKERSPSPAPTHPPKQTSYRNKSHRFSSGSHKRKRSEDRETSSSESKSSNMPESSEKRIVSNEGTTAQSVPHIPLTSPTQKI